MILAALLLILAFDPIVVPLLKVEPSVPDQEKSVIGPKDTERRLSVVSRPTLTAHLAATPNGMAFIIAPGGGFRHLATWKVDPARASA